MDTGLEQFAQKYKLNTADPKVRDGYVQYLFKSMDYKTDMLDAANKGKTEGTEETFLRTLKYMKREHWETAAHELDIKPERCGELIKQHLSAASEEKERGEQSVVDRIRESQGKPKQPRTAKSKKRNGIDK